MSSKIENDQRTAIIGDINDCDGAPSYNMDDNAVRSGMYRTGRCFSMPAFDGNSGSLSKNNEEVGAEAGLSTGEQDFKGLFGSVDLKKYSTVPFRSQTFGQKPRKIKPRSAANIAGWAVCSNISKQIDDEKAKNLVTDKSLTDAADLPYCGGIHRQMFGNMFGKKPVTSDEPSRSLDVDEERRLEKILEQMFGKNSLQVEQFRQSVALEIVESEVFCGSKLRQPPPVLGVLRNEILFDSQDEIMTEVAKPARFGQTVDIIGVRMDEGASVSGCGMGAEAIIEAGLFGVLETLGAAPKNCGIVFSSSANKGAFDDGRLKNLAQVNAVNSLLFDKVSDTLKSNRFPLVFGGDHSLAAATGSAFIAKFSRVGIIWVDAHGDFNNAQSSPSGNIHGMPLSALTGGGPNEILPFLDKKFGFIDPKNAVLIGVRDLDDEEKVRIKDAGVTVISVAEIREFGIEAACKKALAVACAGTNGVYLSFDLDGLDCSVLGGLGTPVEGGLSMDEGISLCRIIASSGQLLGAEIVEYNPTLDPDKTGAQKSICLAQNIITNLKTK